MDNYLIQCEKAIEHIEREQYADSIEILILIADDSSLAQGLLGFHYMTGLGVERDLEKAKSYYLQAIEGKNAVAANNLATLYMIQYDENGQKDESLLIKREEALLLAKEFGFNQAGDLL